MDKNMTLAVMAAAAIHGGVLFGWPDGEASTPRVAKKEKVETIEIRPMPPEPPEVVLSREESPKGSLEAPPRIDDVAVEAKITDFTTPVVPAPPVEIKSMLDRIPTGPIGTPDGTEGIVKLTVFTPGMLDNSPRTVSQIAPQYPYAEKAAGIAGEVHVEFTVDESGRVLEPRVVHSTNRAFEAPTLTAVSKWRFEPGRRDGRIVRFRMIVPVVFSLNE